MKEFYIGPFKFTNEPSHRITYMTEYPIMLHSVVQHPDGNMAVVIGCEKDYHSKYYRITLRPTIARQPWYVRLWYFIKNLFRRIFNP